MNEMKCKKFLLQIFFQAYLSQDFFDLLKKENINFNDWPSGAAFELPKKFWMIANEKSYQAAIISVFVEIPDSVHSETIGKEEINIFYSEYLNFLLALELTKKINLSPENARILCEEFLNKKTSTAKFYDLATATKDFVVNFEEKLKAGDMQVVLSNFPDLSRTIGGFNKGRVTIFTAHSGFGKTNLGVNLLLAAMKDSKSCVYVNMEMDVTDMVKRILQAKCKMSSNDFLNENYIQKISLGLENENNLAKNWITDGSSMSISEISQMIAQIKRKQEIDYLIVDYDQKIIMTDSGTDQEWQNVKRAVELLEAIAKQDGLHCILFAQTNEDAGGAPIASRRAVQPASTVAQFTRNENSTIIKLLKNRHGPVDPKIKIIYDPSKSLIIEDGFYEEPMPPPAAPIGFKRRNIYD